MPCQENSGEDDVEGIPNALKEAMASGLPVISTFHDGIPELIEHKKTGYLVPEKDDLKLAQGLKYFLSYPRVWKRYTRSARQVIVENSDLNKQVIEQQRLYSLIEKNNEIN